MSIFGCLAAGEMELESTKRALATLYYTKGYIYLIKFGPSYVLRMHELHIIIVRLYNSYLPVMDKNHKKYQTNFKRNSTYIANTPHERLVQRIKSNDQTSASTPAIRPGSLTASLAVFPSLQQTLGMVDSNECLGHCDDRFKVKGITDDCGYIKPPFLHASEHSEYVS